MSRSNLDQSTPTDALEHCLKLFGAYSRRSDRPNGGGALICRNVSSYDSVE
ncbi:MAG: hypothetical protein WAV54_08995 [Acidimicrobiales bacterium]|jgi:hypothetical protein